MQYMWSAYTLTDLGTITITSISIRMWGKSCGVVVHLLVLIATNSKLLEFL